MILDGSLKAGDRLPTTLDLARDFGVTVRTIQQAASRLSQRGMLERIPGRGSFVSGRIHSRKIGIVFGINVFGKSDMLFFQRLYPLITKELKRRQCGSALFFPADDGSHSETLAELDAGVVADRLAGFICLAGAYPYSTWFDKHPHIPQAGRGFTHGAPAGESDEFLGLDYLLGRGYRRVAVIQHAFDHKSPRSQLAITAAEQAYARHGLPMQAVFIPGQASTHRQGLDRAREALENHRDGSPEALLVLNDQACVGVIFELLSRKLRIPQDIAVMASSNKGIDILSPCPLTRLEKDPAQLARILVDDVLAKIDGREAKLETWKAELIVGTSCGE